MAVGVSLIVLSVVLALLMVVLALGRPGNMAAAMAAGATAVLLFLCGFGALGARSYVSGEHLDVAGVRVLRRVLTVVCAGTVVMGAVTAAQFGMAGAVLPLLAAVSAVLGLVAMWPVLRPVRQR